MRAASSDSRLFFIADIGTTTVKASLVSGSSPLVTLSEKNAQSVCGLDVISRVLYAHNNGVELLQKKILITLKDMLLSACKAASVASESISGIIITGNTVMLHLVRGLSVQGFEMAPFMPVTVDAAELSFGELFEKADLSADEACLLPGPETPVFFPPCIDAFLGADAVCAALYADNAAERVRFPLLLADVGTNTEIMLISSTPDGAESAYSITCCSTAAGPAFEGGVLGGRYTGSELIHMLAGLLKSGTMDETGLLCATPADLESALGPASAESLGITQEAVRQLQLAKGAVCAAIDTLLQEEGMAVKDVGTFVLCGNFGSALDAEEAERIGLFPAGLAAVTEYAGNAAELGARLLVREEMREKAKKIAASGKLIQLADSRFFARRYIERMNFTR